MNRQTLPINEILVLDRHRLDLGDVQELADSIRRFGLIQPIVVNQAGVLIAGGRRLAACGLLGYSEIEVVFKETLSVDELHELELEENVRRKEMSWQERSLNILTIHELKSKRSAIEGSKWGMSETAEMLGIKSKATVSYNNEIAKRLRVELTLPIESRRFWQCENLSKAWQLRMRDEEDILQAELAKSLAIQSQSKIPEVKSIEETSLDELLAPIEANIDVESGYDTFNPETGVVANIQPPNTYLSGYAPELPPLHFRRVCIICNGSKTGCEHCRQTGVCWTEDSGHASQIFTAPVYEKYKAETIALSPMLHFGSCIDYMLSHPESVDHIITDPPYGIEMSNLSQENTGMSEIDTVEVEHDVESNINLFKTLFPAAFCAIKPNGYFILFCDIMQWNTLYETAINSGFKVQRWPVVWIKTHRCMNQSINQNFTKTIEIAMVCRKGTATLASPAQECHILEAHDDYKDELGHPFVKPFNVWKYLIEHVSYEGQTIFEPFAGRGSGVISIARLNRQFIACEINQTHFNALVENVKQYYLKINPSYSFI